MSNLSNNSDLQDDLLGHLTPGSRFMTVICTRALRKRDSAEPAVFRLVHLTTADSTVS
jgi:hypothetical protein